MLRKFLPLFVLAVIALMVVIAFVVASPFFQDDVVKENAEVEVDEEVVLSSIERKLNEIVIPEVYFDNSTIDEAIEFLRLRSIECDRSGVDDSQKGIGFIVRGPKVISDDDELDGLGGFGDSVDPNAILIKWLRLKDVPLVIALEEICYEAHLDWEIDPDSHKIVIGPKKQSPSLKELKRL
jgi:hypothetical protein